MLTLWRMYLGRTQLELPRRSLLMAAAVGAIAAVFLNYRTIFGRDAGVALLIVMLALKLLETRSQRDALIFIFLGYFLIVTNFLYSQTIPTALYTLGCVWIITAATINCNHIEPRQGYRGELGLAAVMLAQSVPLMLVFFLFFPRPLGPLWGLPHDAHAGKSGLSESMSPGNIARLSLSDAVAFRVEFKSTIPEARNMYWRGPVLWDFDGRTWTVPRDVVPGELRFDPTTPPVEYSVTVEPHNQRWLFALDLPARVPPNAVATSDFQLRSAAPVTNRLRYDTRSFLHYRFGGDESTHSLQRALQLPENANPRTVEFAAALRRKFSDNKELIREVLAMLRNEKFYYTLTPPLLGKHSVDEFLFDVKSGFCEIYASSFAVLMRAAGIPARIVTGYQGGEINPFGNYLIVRQADAHAWTEVWLSEEGWVRVDPTAAVSPLRIQAGIAAAVPRTDPLPLLVRGDYPWLSQARLSWDSIANNWNQRVLGYNPERQRWLLSRVGIKEQTWHTLAVVLMLVTCAIMLGLLPLMLRALNSKVKDPVKSAYFKFCDKLGRKGLPREPAEGPCTYAARLSRLRPELAPRVSAITRLYVALRYGSSASTGAVRELKQQVKQFSA